MYVPTRLPFFRSMESIIIEQQEAGKRLDKLLADRFSDHSRTYFQYLLEKHLVLLNGEVAKKRVIAALGDEIKIAFTLTPEISLEPEEIALDILYEDEELLVINKPAGMVVHPGAGHPSHTFVNALLYHCSQLRVHKGVSYRPGIVHRLDKDTTGVLLAAKNEKVQEKLTALFSSRQVEKEYVAICIGNPGERRIETNIGRHPTQRKEMAVLEGKGKQAITEVKTVSFDGRFSVVFLGLKTGRTHQLRVHLQYIKTPILGDPTYGNVALNKKQKVTRPLLHAKRICFAHPITGKRIEVCAPIAEDMRQFIGSSISVD